MIILVNNYQKQKINEQTREDQKPPRFNAKPKQKIQLSKLKRTQKVRDGALTLFLPLLHESSLPRLVYIEIKFFLCIIRP